jgi:hypothetical protein
MTDRFQTVAARKVEREATEAFHALAAAEDDEDLFILTGLLLEEQLDRERLELMARLLKRAPRLSMGTGRWRRPFLYGAATGYATHGRTIVMEGGEFYAAFRFDRGHVAELVERLCIPESVKLPCGGRLAGDEALLITLRMLAYPARGTDLSHFFRRSTGYLSEVFNFITGLLYDLHSTLLIEPTFGNIKHKLEYFAECVANTEVTLKDGSVEKCPYDNLVIFLDGTFRPCCRPGPLKNCVGGQRFQQSMYNGHKRDHGFNYQGGITPDGLNRELWFAVGPRHDCRMLRESGFEDRLRAFLRGLLNRQFISFGDMGYRRSDVLQAPWKKATLSPAERRYNEIFKRIRISIEWSYSASLPSRGS